MFILLDWFTPVEDQWPVYVGRGAANLSMDARTRASVARGDVAAPCSCNNRDGLSVGGWLEETL